MKKKIFLGLLLIILIFGSFLISLSIENIKTKFTPNSNKLEQEIKEENIGNQKSENEFENKEPESIMDDNISSNSEEEKENNSDNVTTTEPKSSENNQNNQVSQSDNTSINNHETPQQEIPSQQEIWEQLGMTKDQYYNQPMYSYQTVNYKVQDYGSREATELACRTQEDAYAKEHLNGFKCDSVMSPSGNYLGEMARRW